MLFTPETNADTQLSFYKNSRMSRLYSPQNLLDTTNKALKRKIKLAKKRANKESKLKVHNAAIIIQKAFRGYQSRKYIDCYKKLRFTRNILDVKLQEMQDHIDQKMSKFIKNNEPQIIRIQSLFRATRDRIHTKHLKRIKTGCKLLESLSKSHYTSHISHFFRCLTKHYRKFKLHTCKLRTQSHLEALLKQKQEDMASENKGRSRRLKFAQKFKSETTSKNATPQFNFSKGSILRVPGAGDGSTPNSGENGEDIGRNSCVFINSKSHFQSDSQKFRRGKTNNENKGQEDINKKIKEIEDKLQMIEEIERKSSMLEGSFLSLKFDDSDDPSSVNLSDNSQNIDDSKLRLNINQPETPHEEESLSTPALFSQSKSPQDTYFIREPNGKETEITGIWHSKAPDTTPPQPYTTKNQKSPEKRLRKSKRTHNTPHHLQLIKEESFTHKLNSNNRIDNSLSTKSVPRCSNSKFKKSRAGSAGFRPKMNTDKVLIDNSGFAEAVMKTNGKKSQILNKQ
ncbi:unnamed protein product [Moneuplotes crassus]|uniref:Uncharacterized protein n=1 Tax=Euplotes crassus TaxID=5936 RepID=A0AAD1Y512_EUPCR|nr:unnamed protein product [Moneuplotes crassus]